MLSVTLFNIQIENGTKDHDVGDASAIIVLS